MINPPKFTKQLLSVLEAATNVAGKIDADAMLILLEEGLDWERLRQEVGSNIKKVIVATDHLEELEGAAEAGLIPLALNKEQSPLLERLQHACWKLWPMKYSRIIATSWLFTAGLSRIL